MATYLYTLEIAFDSSKNASQLLANSQDATNCWGFTQQVNGVNEQPYLKEKLAFKNDPNDTYQFRLRIGDLNSPNPYSNPVITNLWLTFSPKNTTQPKTTPFLGTSSPPLIYDFNNGNARGTTQRLISLNKDNANCWLIGDPRSTVLTTPWTIQNQGSWEFSVWFNVFNPSYNPYGVYLYKVDPEMDVEAGG